MDRRRVLQGIRLNAACMGTGVHQEGLKTTDAQRQTLRCSAIDALQSGLRPSARARAQALLDTYLILYLYKIQRGATRDRQRGRASLSHRQAAPRKEPP